MEAMEKLKAGVRFSEVATQYSEDKARQGVSKTKKTPKQKKTTPILTSVLLLTLHKRS